MITTVSPSKNVSLRSTISNIGATRIRELYIVHADDQLVGFLESALGGSETAMLVVPQKEWDFSSSAFREVIEDALNELYTCAITLVGTAHGPTPWQDSPLFESEPSIIERMKLRQGHDQGVQEHLRTEVDKICTLRSVKRAQKLRQLSVDALIYRMESGLFYLLDPESASFRPLLREDQAC